jgi:hypothetical protein
MSKQYAERDASALDEDGGYYIRHVSAMTKEGLHSKSDIAAELAFRDKQIDELLEALEEVTEYAEMAMEQANKAGAEWEIGYALHEAKTAIAKVKSKSNAGNNSPGAGKKAVPEGWLLVPVEPTFDMKKSASKFQIGDDDLNLIDMSFEEIGCIYKAMLASAPKHEGGAS